MASDNDPVSRVATGMARKLAAILSADVVGYSRLMGEDEEATVHTLKTYRGIIATLIQQHRGRVVDFPGDNLLAEFGSVVDAVQCAVAIQREIKARNTALPSHRRMQFRLGINLGDVMVEGERLYGDGVNIAARLEAWPRRAACASRGLSMTRSRPSSPWAMRLWASIRSRTSRSRCGCIGSG